MSDDLGGWKPPSLNFVPVCAIGASAGGVTALQGLFRRLPIDLGLAYVVILHLSPDHPSAMSEILADCTRMPVLQIDDGPTLRRDCVFVIPPDRELVIEGDSVAARPFTEPRGRRAPIDMFFRSVAAARGDGIAVVLSGAGADGALGVRAVKEAGGVIMVQEPADAGFSSMPQNAIATGMADFIAPIARLAERIAEVARSKEAVRSLDMDGSANDLRRIVTFLRTRTGHDFSSYKRATVMRRVVRRMQVCRADTLAAYAEYLLATPDEAKELFSDLLISVTMFFRDPQAYEALRRQAIKPLFDDLRPAADDVVRAWVVGCATGEEAYSLAILLLEEADRRKLHPQLQIFATDLDEAALATAREGRYPRAIEADVSEERLTRFFVDEGTHYRVRKELRESVLFATHSVIKEPPFMRLDVITCRNLLIYLERSMQKQLCTIFHYGLKPGRFLFLGSAETTDIAPELFLPLDRDARIYGARPHGTHMLPILPQFASPARPAGPDQPVLSRVERANLPASLHVSALERSAPPTALVDEAQNVLHLSQSAGRYILHTLGPMSDLLPAVVRPELRLDLRLALTRAFDSKEPTLTHPTVVAMEGGFRRIAMHITLVPNPVHMAAQALVAFLDGGAAPGGGEPESAADMRPDEVRRLHAELKAAQEALVASRNGHEAAIQDLRASNEELQSINEEYRSTAEELETSKEELQSINEELHTVNAELKSKLESISIAHSDLQNLTSSTEIGTLFLDPDLRIRMFTAPVAELFNVTRADIGRAITDFTNRLDYSGLAEDARRVLRDLLPIETEVQSRDAQWYTVRLRPYRTIEDRIDGTVATFVNITARRQAEAALRDRDERLRLIVEGVRDYAIFTTDVDGRIVDWLPSAAAVFGWTAGEIVGQPIALLFTPEDRERGEVGRELGTAERKGVSADVRWHLRRDGSRVLIDGSTRALHDGGGRTLRLLKIGQDVTERHASEGRLRESEVRFRALATAGSSSIYRMSPDWRLMYQLDSLDSPADTTGPDENWPDDYILPEDRQAMFAAIAEAIGNKAVFQLEHRIRRADGSVGWTLTRAVPILGSGGEIVEWVGAATDVTERRLAQERLRTLIGGIPQLVWRAGADGLWSWSSPQWQEYTGQTEAQSLGWGWLDVVHPDDHEATRQAWHDGRLHGRLDLEYRVRRASDGAWRWHQTRSVPVRNAPALVRDDAEEPIVEWLGTTTDIEDLKRFQGQQEMMVAELQHRTRNLLAVVRNVARRSLPTSAGRDQYDARLAALGRVQGFLSRSSLYAVPLADLVQAELAAAGDGASDRVTVAGPAVELPGESVQAVALALHELATNAVKYGAIGQPSGRLAVTWRVDDQTAADGGRLVIDWQESGVKMIDSAPARHGYGTELITKALPYQLQADTSLQFDDDGVSCRITLPAGTFETVERESVQ